MKRDLESEKELKLTVNTFSLTACIIAALCLGCAGPQVSPVKEEAPPQGQKGVPLDAATREKVAKLFDDGLMQMEKNPKEALRLFNYILPFVSERWEVHYNMGLAYMKLGEYAKSEDAFLKALKYKAPPRVYNALASAYLAGGNKAKAIEALKKGLDLEESVGGLINIANIYQGLGQNDNAIRFYRKAEAADPANMILHHNFGVLLYNMGNYKGALDEFNKALGKNGADNARGLSTSAQAILKTGDFEGAVKVFQKMLSTAPGDPAPYLNIGVIYEIYLGDRDKAIENYTTYINKGGPRVKEVEAWIDVVKNRAKPKEGGG